MYDHSQVLQGTSARTKFSRAYVFLAVCTAAGTANGKIVLAQADSAVAMAQTEKVDRLAPVSRTAWQN
jgi:hypothetical protein